MAEKQRKRVIHRDRDFDNKRVTFTALDENEEPTNHVLETRVEDLPDHIKDMLATHALNAKVGDAAAGDHGEAAYENMKKVWDQLCEGTWVAKGGGEGSARVTILAQAIARLKNIDTEEAASKLDDYSDEDKKELQKHPTVKAELDKLRAERAAERAKKAEKESADAGDIDF